MRPCLITVTILFVLFQPMVMAQQAGENINVLPVVFPVDDPDHWFLKGDGYLQRQVEPTIAASTRNPDHLIAFFNDYRAVDIEDDVGLGEAEGAALIINTARVLYASARWIPLPEIEVQPRAAAEAWVGMSRSYDGGLTWSGAFLPGGPFDESPASVASPIYGLQAATDPVVAPGPCGKFYVVFMAFNRGDESKLVVARYQDLNNIEGGDTIVYQGMSVVESGNNATNGHFLDKPDIEVDIFRDDNPDLCADRVYVSYSTFTGLAQDGSFQSKLHVASSFDGGLTFKQTKINQPYTQNQGSALAIDPANGTLYAFWRHFYSPDAIVMIKSANYGKKWSKPVAVTGNIVPMAAFDQPTISTTVAPLSAWPNPGFPETAFRSNGFPTVAVNKLGTLFVAWQERVGVDPLDQSTFGKPLDGGSPRVVLVRSENGGATWYGTNGIEGDRVAVDMADRDTGTAPELGFGTLHQPRASGPQVMPKLSFGADRLMLAYYESRGRIFNYGSGTYNEEIIPDADVSPYTGFISGYDQVVDLRAAILDPTTGTLLNPGSTTQVSRYPIRAGADLADGTEDFTDVAAVNSPCTPDSGPGYAPCIRQVNRANAPQSAAGTSPFMGDYVDMAPMVQFVYDNNAWRWATEVFDVPGQSFHAIFADNRHLIPPVASPGFNEWDLFPYYSTPFDSQCTNPGSRNTDVLTSKVNAGLILSAPTSYKQLDAQRGFPISISNQTDSTQTYFVEIITGADQASFSRVDSTIDSGPLEIFAHSGTSLMVYVEPWSVPPIRIQVAEISPCSGECSSGFVTLNLDPENPPVAALDGFPDSQYPEITDPFVINPFVINDGVENPFVINPFVINPFVINPFVINPFVINPFVINPFVINPFVINQSIEDVIDTTWTVTAGGSNTASSYLPLVNIDNAQAFIDAGYVFQLIAYKGSLYGGLGADGCGSANISQPQILANVVQDPGAQNPFVINPFVINPFVINPFVINDGVQNPFVINSAFTIAPSDDANLDGTTKAPPASNDVHITLRAFKLETTTKTDPLTPPPIFDPLVDPPSMVIVPLPCDPYNPVNCNVVSLAPDLVPDGVATAGVIADSGGILEAFPSGGWILKNQGYGDATAENGILRHGFHVCDNEYIDGYPADESLDVSDPLTCTPTGDFIHTPGDTVPLIPGEIQYGSIDLNIPALPEGDYSLVLYVDDTLEISEFNEVNNWVAVPITIEEPNEPPTATDTTFNTDEDTILSAPLPAEDPDGDALSYTVTSATSDGDLTLDGGSFTYAPDLNFDETDSFVFEVSDGEFSASATVTIIVNPVNDPPVVIVEPVAVNEDTSAEIVVTATDVDGDELTFTVSTPPANGTVTSSSGGTFIYVPDADFHGTDTFSVTVNDTVVDITVTVDVTINPVNDAPSADPQTVLTDEDTPLGITLTGGDIDGDTLTFTVVTSPTNGTLTGTPPALTYTPNLNFNSEDSFTFKTNDGELDSNTATVSITVTPINDPPTAADAAFEAFENTPLNGILTGHDVDGDSVAFLLGTAPAGGTAVIDPASGAFTYTPAAGFLGTDVFTFLVLDPFDSSATGTVTINVIDPVPNWDFVGFSTPWRPSYKVKVGSAIPLKWYYTDPDSGELVSSYHADLEITATGYSICDPASDPIAVLDLPEDTGSSDLRYNGGNWQLNWDTSGLEKGCYYLSIYHPHTNQIDTESHTGYPLKIQLK